MSVTSGFFNSFNGDRKYNAEQMSAIFDGIINDGVFASVGTAFTVSATSGVSINVGTGRAWFNSTWLLNDSILPISCDISEVVLNRIDAVVIEIDHSDSVRAGSIKVIKGTPASTPERPSMAHTEDVNQYPLAYIYRAAGSGEIRQADITNMIGSSECPYITGILQVINNDNIVAQWKDQWDRWFTTITQQSESQTSQWMSETKAEFDAWFDSLVATLDQDVAANLAAQMLEIQERFEILVREKAVYDDLKDSNGELIEDSYGSVVEAKTVLSSSDATGTVDDSKIQDILDELNRKQEKITGTPGDLIGIGPTGDIESVNARPRRVDIVIRASAWSSLSQTVSVPGVSADEKDQIIQVIPASSSKTYWKESGVEPDSQGLDSITFKARTNPSNDITAYVVIQEVVSA